METYLMDSFKAGVLKQFDKVFFEIEISNAISSLQSFMDNVKCSSKSDHPHNNPDDPQNDSSAQNNLQKDSLKANLSSSSSPSQSKQSESKPSVELDHDVYTSLKELEKMLQQIQQMQSETRVPRMTFEVLHILQKMDEAVHFDIKKMMDGLKKAKESKNFPFTTVNVLNFRLLFLAYTTVFLSGALQLFINRHFHRLEASIDYWKERRPKRGAILNYWYLWEKSPMYWFYYFGMWNKAKKLLYRRNEHGETTEAGISNGASLLNRESGYDGFSEEEELVDPGVELEIRLNLLRRTRLALRWWNGGASIVLNNYEKLKTFEDVQNMVETMMMHFGKFLRMFSESTKIQGLQFHSNWLASFITQKPSLLTTNIIGMQQQMASHFTHHGNVQSKDEIEDELSDDGFFRVDHDDTHDHSNLHRPHVNFDLQAQYPSSSTSTQDPNQQSSIKPQTPSLSSSATPDIHPINLIHSSYENATPLIPNLSTTTSNSQTSPAKSQATTSSGTTLGTSTYLTHPSMLTASTASALAPPPQSENETYVFVPRKLTSKNLTVSIASPSAQILEFECEPSGSHQHRHEMFGDVTGSQQGFPNSTHQASLKLAQSTADLSNSLPDLTFSHDMTSPRHPMPGMLKRSATANLQSDHLASGPPTTRTMDAIYEKEEALHRIYTDAVSICDQLSDVLKKCHTTIVSMGVPSFFERNWMFVASSVAFTSYFGFKTYKNWDRWVMKALEWKQVGKRVFFEYFWSPILSIYKIIRYNKDDDSLTVTSKESLEDDIEALARMVADFESKKGLADSFKEMKIHRDKAMKSIQDSINQITQGVVDNSSSVNGESAVDGMGISTPSSSNGNTSGSSIIVSFKNSHGNSQSNINWETNKKNGNELPSPSSSSDSHIVGDNGNNSIHKTNDNNEEKDNDEVIKFVMEEARKGNIPTIMRAYEKQIAHPIINGLAGDLLTLALIQIQKQKVDMEKAMAILDRILKQNQLLMQIIAALPAAIFGFALFKVITRDRDSFAAIYFRLRTLLKATAVLINKSSNQLDKLTSIPPSMFYQLSAPSSAPTQPTIGIMSKLGQQQTPRQANQSATNPPSLSSSSSNILRKVPSNPSIIYSGMNNTNNAIPSNAPATLQVSTQTSPSSNLSTSPSDLPMIMESYGHLMILIAAMTKEAEDLPISQKIGFLEDLVELGTFTFTATQRKATLQRMYSNYTFLSVGAK